MIKYACRPPAENIKLIMDEGLSMLGIQKSAQVNIGNVSDSSLQVLLQFETASARRIQSPTLRFLKNNMSGEDSARGQWNLANRRFREAGRVCKYGILVLKKPSEPSIANIEEFSQRLRIEIGKYFNQALSKDPTPVREFNYPTPEQNAPECLRGTFQACLNSGIEYLFIIHSDAKWYPDIKRTADKIGLHTTLSLRKKGGIVKSSIGEIANLLLKFNLKVGGSNWDIDPAPFGILRGSKNVMFVGIDVVHPPPGAMKNAPSVAAIVASVAPGINQQYPGSINLQHHTDTAKKSVEIINNLTAMLTSRLELWSDRNNGNLPEMIFIYRDGVSDSQLDQVLQTEVPLIEQACKMQYAGKSQGLPTVYLQVSQKRHIARFYGPDGDKSKHFDQRRNPLPGLVVDTKVVHKSLCDWYQISHKCLQGTSRPAHHYPIFTNGVILNMDDLQQLTQGLAFVFGRSVTSISIPAPARLADILCERAKVFLHEVYFPSQPDQVFEPARHFLGQRDISPRLRDTMYYI
jgi:eukaryotic translation initiation factor 2C